MSLLTKASLIATPTAYGDGVLNSVKPTNGDGDFDFARASAATRVNEQGLIEKERGNLLLQSNQFDTTWTTSDVSVTSGQSGYDGSSDAWLLTATSTLNCRINQSISSSGVKTLSVYAKAGTADWVIVQIGGGTASYAWFDLSSGAVGTSGQLINSEITSVGGGWYRCSITGANSNTSVNIYVATADNSVSTSSGDTIYIQDAQLEQGLVATDYIETTTAAVYEGITDDIPRINYENGIGSFLLEPQRTNLVPYSEYFGGWNKSTGAITITSNYGISPEGLQNSSRIQFTGASQHINISTSLGIGVTSTGSVYIKGVAGETIQFDTGGVGTLKTLTGDWQRIQVTSVSVSSLLLINTFGGATARDIEVWGAQMEEASYPTSYIPTYGTSVTRVAETCNNAGDSSLFNDSEGVLYAEMAAISNDSTGKHIAISNGTSSNATTIYFYANSINAVNYVSGVNQFYFNQTLSDVTHMHKVALKYKANDFALWLNGVEIATDSSGSVPSGMDTLSFDNGGGSANFYGKVKMVSTFTEALSDSELECLTSWSSFNRMATAQGYTIQ